MKILRAFGVVAVLMGLLVMSVQAAGPPGSWTTDFTILNLESQPAAVQIMRYTQCTTGCTADSGTLVKSVTIPASGSEYYNPAFDANFPTGFAGSIVVSSDRRIATTVTVANDQTGSAYASDAYAGVSEVSSSVFLPIIMGNLGVWNTRIAVQNAGSETTNVTITYIGSGAPAATTISGLPPNMMALVDQGDISGISNFNGSATVTSSGSQPLAVVVDEYKTSGGVLVSYVGVPLSQASTTIYMPGYIALNVWATDFTMVNTTGDAATVSVAFSGASNALNGTIPANGSVYVNPYIGAYGGLTGSAPTSGYYGSATVTSNKNIVVVYNISNSGGGPGNYAMGYVGFPATGGAKTVAVPLIENHYSSGWDTTFSVQNIEGGTANLSMAYSGNVAANCSPCTYQMTTSSHTFNQVTDGHIPAGFIGGVTITSDKDIVVIGDQNLTGGAGDTSAGFPGIATQ